MTPTSQPQLLQYLEKTLNDADLRRLCFELQVTYDNLSGPTLTERLIALIGHLQRREQLPALQTYLQEHRPNTPWAQIFSAMARETAPGQPGSLFPLRHYPFPPNPDFQGRQQWLDRLHQALTPATPTPLPVCVVAGLGGLGKTQLSLAYSYRHSGEYALLYWLSANDTVSLQESLADLAQRLGLVLPGQELAETVQNVLRWLKTCPHRWLLVYDNADDIDPVELQPYLPDGGKGACLITSRNPEWRGIASHTLLLESFLPEEAVAFLHQRSGRTEPEAAQTLAKLLGYFPLALEHAAAYCSVSSGPPLADYVRLYQTRRQALWAQAEPRNDYPNTILSTWSLALEKARTAPGAADLFALCCFLAPQEIPLFLFTDHTAQLPSALAACVADELALNKAIATLGRYSLLRRQDRFLQMHPLVQTIARDQGTPEQQTAWLEVAVAVTRAAFPNDLDTTYHLWQEARTVLPHVRAVVENAIAAGWESESLATLCNELGFYLKCMGEAAAARPFYERALAIWERALGPDHPDTATSLNNMGLLLQEMGEVAAARPYLERALAITERVLGPDHPDTALSLNNIASLLYAMGELAAARPYLERALAITERVLGPNHPSTALSLNNMGMLLQEMGSWRRPGRCMNAP